MEGGGAKDKLGERGGKAVGRAGDRERVSPDLDWNDSGGNTT